MRFRTLLVIAASTLSLLGIFALPALASGRPTHITGGGHTCSYTSPEYMLSDYNMDVQPSPGSTAFTAAWTPGHHPWEDAYWVTGYHDENSSICNKRELPGSHGKYGQSLVLPIRVSERKLITADVRAQGTGRLGFDLWFAAGTAETGPSRMERDHRTWEIMVEPGSGGVFRDNPGWHRVYMAILPEHGGTVSFRGLDLTRIAQEAGVPGSNYWMAIDAGAETTYGSFTVDSYALHIADQHPRPRPRTYTATASVRVRARVTAEAGWRETEHVTVRFRGVRVTARATARGTDRFTATAWSRKTNSQTARTYAQALAMARARALSRATSAARTDAGLWAVRGSHLIAQHRARVKALAAARRLALHRAEVRWLRLHSGHREGK